MSVLHRSLPTLTTTPSFVAPRTACTTNKSFSASTRTFTKLSTSVAAFFTSASKFAIAGLQKRMECAGNNVRGYIQSKCISELQCSMVERTWYT
tara:strand:+ start:199 stop:480 length:282 start_codon:yes stop_codon:yes gene_type:complete